MLKEAGLLPPPAPQTPPPKKKSFSVFAVLRKIPGWFLALTLGVATLTGLLAFYPWLSIEQDYSSDPTNPFTEVFAVTNEGYLPAEDVHTVCSRNAVFAGNIVLGGFTEEGDELITDSLSYKGRASIPCTPKELLWMGAGHPVQTATFTIYVRYRMAIFPIKRVQSFKFQLTKDSMGHYHWLYMG